jgi:hypothetical protein
MTPAAQNALLKTLEEPPSYAVLLLLADGTSSFLPTIMSRCITLPLRPVAEKAVAEEVVAVVEPSAEQSIPATPRGEMATVVLTERDIPITRPENYEYTPEEIALMKKQANEAYLKWVELELEIAKYHIEQTAQK